MYATLGLLMQAEVAKLDYMRFLPLFLDGIRETQDPYRFLAIKVSQLCQAAIAKLCQLPGLRVPSKCSRKLLFWLCGKTSLPPAWQTSSLIQGCEDLLQVGGDQILLTIPLCVQPLKRALNTRDKQVLIFSYLHTCTVTSRCRVTEFQPEPLQDPTGDIISVASCLQP